MPEEAGDLISRFVLDPSFLLPRNIVRVGLSALTMMLELSPCGSLPRLAVVGDSCLFIKILGRGYALSLVI